MIKNTFATLCKNFMFVRIFFQLSCTGYLFFSYKIMAGLNCTVTSSSGLKDHCPRLNTAFLRGLRNVQGTSKAKCKEIFLRDLRIAREKPNDVELKQVLFEFNFFYLESFYIQLHKIV